MGSNIQLYNLRILEACNLGTSVLSHASYIHVPSLFHQFATKPLQPLQQRWENQLQPEVKTSFCRDDLGINGCYDRLGYACFFTSRMVEPFGKDVTLCLGALFMNRSHPTFLGWNMAHYIGRRDELARKPWNNRKLGVVLCNWLE